MARGKAMPRVGSPSNIREVFILKVWERRQEEKR